jgi:hypothetical protein
MQVLFESHRFESQHYNITNLRELVAKGVKPLMACSIGTTYTISHPVTNSQCMTQSRLKGNSHLEALFRFKGLVICIHQDVMLSA